MDNGFFSNYPAPTKLFISIFIILSIFLIVSILGVLIAVPVFGLNFSTVFSALSDFSDQPNVPLLKFMQIMQSLGLFLIPPFIIAWLFNQDGLAYLKARSVFSLKTGVFTAIVMFASIPFINLLAQMNSGLDLPEQFAGLERWMEQTEGNAQRITELFLSNNQGVDLLVNFLMIAIIPAIGEEFLFRGVLQRLFSEWTNSKHWGIVIAALLFSAFHLQFYGFIPRMLLGVLFGYLFVWSRTIWLPVFAHFVNNAMAVIFYYFYSVEEVNNQVDTFGASSGTYLFSIISVLLAGTLIFLIYKNERTSTS